MRPLHFIHFRDDVYFSLHLTFLFVFRHFYFNIMPLPSLRFSSYHHLSVLHILFSIFYNTFSSFYFTLGWTYHRRCEKSHSWKLFIFFIARRNILDRNSLCAFHGIVITCSTHRDHPVVTQGIVSAMHFRRRKSWLRSECSCGTYEKY